MCFHLFITLNCIRHTFQSLISCFIHCFCAYFLKTNVPTEHKFQHPQDLGKLICEVLSPRCSVCYFSWLMLECQFSISFPTFPLFWGEVGWCWSRAVWNGRNLLLYVAKFAECFFVEFPSNVWLQGCSSTPSRSNEYIPGNLNKSLFVYDGTQIAQLASYLNKTLNCYLYSSYPHCLCAQTFTSIKV